MMPNLKSAVFLVVLLACAACKRTPIAQQSPAPPAAPVPFHPAVLFLAYDGAPAKLAEMTFQLNVAGSSEFLHLGDTIPKTTIRLSDFDPATQELIVTDTTTNQRARLAPPKPVDSPSTF